MCLERPKVRGEKLSGTWSTKVQRLTIKVKGN